MMGQVKGIVELGKSNIDLLMWVLVCSAALLFFLRQCWCSYIFLRRLHAGKSRGSFLRIAMMMFHVAIQRPASLISREKPFLRFIRIRAEHEIFNPRPIWQWPLPDDEDDYGKGVYALTAPGRDPSDTRKAAHKAAHRKFKKALKEWRADMAKVLNDPDPNSESKTMTEIDVDHAGKINDELSTIKRYFDTLKTLNVLHGGELKFFCTVNVRIGFIASQHLLGGLLVRYNQNWSTIIDGFERDTNLAVAGGQGMSRDIRQIQSFIYHCWLLWGPSIPVCAHSCGAWNADFSTLQFGYGDENNAIEIVGDTDFLREQVEALIGRQDKRMAGAMAIPAAVRGRLQYSSIVDRNARTIPKALRESWSSPETERPVLFISREAAGSEESKEEYPAVGLIRREDHGPDEGPGHSRYYSAYLWVMFVILRPAGKGWGPLYPKEPMEGFAPGSGEPWKGTVPFFEHGNMADAETCAFTKRQLAVKALSGIVEMARLSGERKLKFAYACAIDDANCSEGLAFRKLMGRQSVRAVIDELLADKANSTMVRAAELIDFDLYHPGEDGPWNPHSACAQTDWVHRHYADLDRTLAQAES
jgi:hypothetical protein